MKVLNVAACALTGLACLATPAFADAITVRGKVTVAQGHVGPSCRMVQLRRADDGTYTWFRITATGQEDGILATALTALATGLDVDINYDPAVSSGCGAEPRIAYISLRAPGAP